MFFLNVPGALYLFPAGNVISAIAVLFDKLDGHDHHRQHTVVQVFQKQAQDLLVKEDGTGIQPGTDAAARIVMALMVV